MNRVPRLSIAVVPLLLLGACTGGGSISEPSEPPPTSAKVECEDNDGLVRLADSGMTSKKDAEGLYRTSFAAVFSVDTSVTLVSGTVQIGFVKGKKAKLTMRLRSTVDDKTNISTAYVFRDSSDKIIGGTNDADANLDIANVSNGSSEHSLEFGWESKNLPDPDKIAAVYGYALVKR